MGDVGKRLRMCGVPPNLEKIVDTNPGWCLECRPTFPPGGCVGFVVSTGKQILSFAVLEGVRYAVP